MLVPIFDTHFVEASLDVEFGENERVLYFCNQFWYEGEWVSVADCPFIDASVILHWSLRPIGFSEEEKG